MKIMDYCLFLLKVSNSQVITRRYIVTNGFDAIFTMLGLNMGFYVSGEVTVELACYGSFGAGVALTMSGLTSAYISEAAERNKYLKELEQAMVAKLHGTSQGQVAQFIPIWVALINGLFPLLIISFITAPLWLTLSQWFIFPLPIVSTIVLSLLSLFMLGIYAGSISGTAKLWSGVRTLLIGITIAIIVLVLT
jgi:VIT family.